MNSATNHVTVIVGSRRTGKTTELVDLADAQADAHACFLLSQKPGPFHLPDRAVVVYYGATHCPTQSFLDVLDGETNTFTHLFIDDVESNKLDAVLHLAKRLPELTITVAMKP